MLRAKTLMRDPGRLVEAASDFLVVLRELGRSEGTARAFAGPVSSFRLDAPPGSGLGGGAGVSPPARAVHQEATLGLWSLHRQFADARALDVALAVAKVDPARGFEALSRYVHTHPCAWDAQAHLGTLALAARRFDVTTKMLGNVRWLFPDDPNPHFVYGQALASQGRAHAAVAALEHAAALSPGDPDIAAWLGYAREQSAGEPRSRRAKSIHLSHHVARSLLLRAGFVRAGRVSPAALATPKLPGDFPFAFALHEIAELEKQHGGAGVGVAGRCVLSDYSGAGVRAEGTIGEIPDPGVVVVLVYAEPWQDAAGRPFEGMSPAQCRASLLRAAQANSAISAALERHLASEEATIKARLGSA
jgi:tetratricopeptide (TPR) repeat protein